MKKLSLEYYIDNQDLRQYVENALQSENDGPEKEFLLMQSGVDQQKIQEILAAIDKGDLVRKSRENFVSQLESSPSLQSKSNSTIEQANDSFYTQTVSLRSLNHEVYSEEVLGVHFILQYLSVSFEVDSDIFQMIFGDTIYVRELHQFFDDQNCNNKSSLFQLLNKVAPNANRSYSINRQLADLDLRPAKAPLSSKTILSYEEVIPKFFLERKPNLIKNQLEQFKQRQHTIEALFEYYKIIVNEDESCLQCPENQHQTIDNHCSEVIYREVEHRLSYEECTRTQLGENLPYNSEAQAKSFDELIFELLKNIGHEITINQLISDYEILHSMIGNKRKLADSNPEVDYEILGKIIATVKEIYNFDSRPIQVMSVLLFIRKHNTKGRLLQINSGEGKSLIISMLAAYHALRGKKVDIVTSSENLAKRDVEENASFYEALGLKVGQNVDFYDNYDQDETDVNVYKDCDILYGTVSEFSADILRDFSLNKSICKRDKDFLIVDEVDNMLIDCESYITKLSQQSHCLEALKNVRFEIWSCLNFLVLANEGKPLALLSEFVKIQILSIEETFNLNRYYKEIFDLILDPWIESAIQAKLHLKENIDYLVKDKEIIIIDKENTGEMQLNTRWQFGLHGFLEMKHNFPPHGEGFTSLYYSNLKFFEDYKFDLCGLTGTLGSEACRTFLRNTYNVDMLEIPTYKPKLFTELPSIVCSAQEVISTVVGQASHVVYDQKRPVLIIVKTILECHQMIKFLQDAKIPVIPYIYSDEERLHEKVEQIKENVVIVATNLAGRGTDIKLDPNLEEKGGLHVILGFLPQNLRVEQQAFGRTARKGCRGDAIMIVPNNCFGDPITDIKRLRSHRDDLEEQHLNGDAIQSVQNCRIRDRMFEMFYTRIKNIPNLKLHSNQMLGLNEQWALFYLKFDLMYSSLPEKEQMDTFDEFLQEVISNFEIGYYSKNHIYYLLEADKELTHSEDNNKAQEYVDKAQQIMGEQSTADILSRQAIIQFNNGNREGSQAAIKKALSTLTKHNQMRAISQNRLESSALINRVNKISENPTSLANICNQLNLESDLLQDRNLIEKSLRTELRLFIDQNELIQNMRKEIETTDRVFRNNLTLIESMINQSSTKIKLKLDDDLKEIINPEIPMIDLPPQFTSRKGYLGYVIGGAGIVAGFLITIYGGPIFRRFGGPMIFHSLSLIFKNYEMNKNNNYSNQFIKDHILDIAYSFVRPIGSMWTHFALNQITVQKYEKLTMAALDPNSVKEILIKAFQNSIEAIVGGAKFQPFLSKAIEEDLASSEESTGKNPTNEADLQIELNKCIKELYERNVERPLEKISPQRIQNFYDNLAPFIERKLDDLMECSINKKGANHLVWAYAILTLEKETDSGFLEKTIASLKKKAHKELLNVNIEEQVLRCLEFKNFDDLSDLEVNPIISLEFQNVVDTFNGLNNLQVSLSLEFRHYIMELLNLMLQINAADLDRTNTLPDQARNPSLILKSLELVSEQKENLELSQEVEKFTSALSLMVKNEEFESKIFPLITLFVFNNLFINAHWVPTAGDFKEVLEEDLYSLADLICMFFKDSLYDRNSKLSQVITKAKTIKESIKGIFYDPIEHDLINSISLQL